MQETTTLNALVMRRARDLIADYGWPDHTDVDQRDPVNKPGWISIYVRLDAANIVHLLPLLCTGDVPAELQSAMTKIAGTPAQIILSGSRYADAPQLPEDGTQIAFPWAGEWLTAIWQSSISWLPQAADEWSPVGTPRSCRPSQPVCHSAWCSSGAPSIRW